MLALAITTIGAAAGDGRAEWAAVAEAFRAYLDDNAASAVLVGVALLVLIVMAGNIALARRLARGPRRR